MIKILLFFLLSPLFQLSVVNVDTTNLQTTAPKDTVPDSVVMHQEPLDTINPFEYFEGQDEDSDPIQFKPKCVLDCGLMIQLVAVLIAIITLCLSFKQTKDSSKQAKQSYDKFVETSKTQFEIQTATLTTIREQTDKIYDGNNKKEIIGYLSDCHTSIELVSKYLKDHFSNIVWNVKTEEYVFNLLQPIIKSATAMEISISSEKNEEDFLNAVKMCANLGKKELRNRKDIEQLIEQLDNTKIVFVNKINQIKEERNG